MSLEAAVVRVTRQSVHPVRDTSKHSPARIGQAAADFKGLLRGQMLKSVREALKGDDAEKHPHSTMIEFGEQQFAQAVAGSGGVGIAKMVVAGLTKHAD